MLFSLKVKYCSENHRLLHHPEDHEEPWPIIVKYKPGVKKWKNLNCSTFLTLVHKKVEQLELFEIFDLVP